MSGSLKGNGAYNRVKRAYLLFIIPAAAIIVLDQISKSIVLHTIPLHGSISVIEGFFNLVHTRNRGMAFGFLNRPGSHLGFYLLVTATFIAISILILWFFRLKKTDRPLVLSLSFVLGGALGNLIDRLRLGEVIDFIDIFVGSYHWPAFNAADSAITVGTIWLAIQMLFLSSAKSGNGR